MQSAARKLLAAMTLISLTAATASAGPPTHKEGHGYPKGTSNASHEGYRRDQALARQLVMAKAMRRAEMRQQIIEDNIMMDPQPMYMPDFVSPQIIAPPVIQDASDGSYADASVVDPYGLGMGVPVIVSSPYYSNYRWHRYHNGYNNGHQVGHNGGPAGHHHGHH